MNRIRKLCDLLAIALILALSLGAFPDTALADSGSCLKTEQNGRVVIIGAGCTLQLADGATISFASDISIPATGSLTFVTGATIEGAVSIDASAVDIASAAGIGLTADAGDIDLDTGGGVTIVATDPATLSVGGDPAELTIDTASTTVVGAFRLTGSAAPPVACAAGTAGTLYYDSTVNFTCICNGTAYVRTTDDTTTTGCA